MSDMPIITKDKVGAMLFLNIAQITKLLLGAYTNGQAWSYDIGLLQDNNGERPATRFEDGCTITIRIEPKGEEQKPAPLE